MRIFPRNDRAFTGLEAALVLIAFIIVATVFSYVVLNSGFFATQRSKEVVYTAVEQAGSTMGFIGHVYGIRDEETGSAIAQINFTAKLGIGGSAVDFEKVVLTFSNSSRLETLRRDPATFNPAGCMPYSGTWAVYSILNDEGPGDTLLEQGEMFAVSACPSEPIPAGDEFNLEIRPATGVTQTITRTVPATLSAITSLR